MMEKPEPTITTKPQNIITAVGLPVTLTCHVEGDPSSYWVGWMSQHAIIQEGEDHSISTSPSFKSTNGTVHHLTIHRVKESGKYHCEVYTISKKVDQVTHQVIADDGKIYPVIASRCMHSLLLQKMTTNHLHHLTSVL